MRSGIHKAHGISVFIHIVVIHQNTVLVSYLQCVVFIHRVSIIHSRRRIVLILHVDGKEIGDRILSIARLQRYDRFASFICRCDEMQGII